MVNFNEFIKIAEEKIQKGYLVAALTDEYRVDCWPMNGNSIDERKLLEIRIFNKDGELKLIRTDISKEFIFRDSKNIQYEDSFRETQRLDIDTKEGRTATGYVTTTGGGKYYFPFEKIDGATIEIEQYISKYEDSGQARICDWRLVDIKEGR